MDFYAAAGTGFVVALVVCAVIVYYYDKKWVPAQQKRGRSARKLENLINSLLKNGYAEKEPFEWLSAKPFQKVPYKIKQLFTLRNLNIFLNVLTVALVALRFADWWLLPVLQTIANIIAYAPKHNQRNAIVRKMAEAAHKKLHWPAQSMLTPWSYVQVVEWDGNTPLKAILKLNTDFDATNPATKDSFERQFNASVSKNNNWMYEWETADGKITISPVALLPTIVKYEGSKDFDWNIFPVGVGINGPVTYDIQKYPHVLVGGTTGSGKSVLQRNIIFHCIQHNDMWRFLGVDLKRVELGPFKKYETTVMGIADELEDGVEVIRYAQRVMNTRYTQMVEAGVNHFKNLIDPKTGKTKERALLIMVDEAAMFMGMEGVKTDEGKARDDLHGEAVGIIGALARLGRASGVHLVLATQRPDATFIPGETKNNLDVRIAAGRLDSTPSSMILDNGAATMLDGEIKGRGVIRYAGKNQEFQGYYAEPEWIDEWLMKNPGVEPTLNPLEGQTLEDQLTDLPDDIDFEDGLLSLEADVMPQDLEAFADQLEEYYEDQVKAEEDELYGDEDRDPADGKIHAEPEIPFMPFLEDDDDEPASPAAQKPAVAQVDEKPKLTPNEIAILQKLNESFAEEAAMEKQLEPADEFDLASDSLTGIPAFDNEGTNLPERAAAAAAPAAATPAAAKVAFPPSEKFTPPLPKSNAFPAPAALPEKKAFPPPPKKQ